MVSIYSFVADSRFKKDLLHIPREVRPQCEHGLTQQAFEFVG